MYKRQWKDIERIRIRIELNVKKESIKVVGVNYK
jgi:hypothetical protein